MQGGNGASKLENLYLEIPVNSLEYVYPSYATLPEAVQAIQQIHEQNPDIPVHSVLDMDGTIAPGKPNQWEFFITSVAAIRCKNRTDNCQKEELVRIIEIYQQFQNPFLDWAYGMRDLDLDKYYPKEARVSQDIKEILEWSANLYNFMRDNYFKNWQQEFSGFLERNPAVRNYLHAKYEKQMRDDGEKVTYIDNQHLAEFLTEQHIRNVIWHIATYKLRMKLLETHFARQKKEEDLIILEESEGEPELTIQELTTNQMLTEAIILGQDHFNSMPSEQQQKYREAIKKLVEISQESSGKVIIDSFGIPELVEGYLLAALGKLEVSDKEDPDKNGLPENIIILGPNMEDMLVFINTFDSFWPQYSQGGDWDAPVSSNVTLDVLAKKLDSMSNIFSPISFPVASSKAIALHDRLIDLGLINVGKNGNLRVQGILAGLGDSSTYDVFLWYILGLKALLTAADAMSSNSNQRVASFLITNK